MIDVLETPLDESAVLDDLTRLTYDEVRIKYGISRGRIYGIAVRHGARKNESRIREKLSERKQRQQEFLREVLNATEKSDVLDFLAGLPDESVSLHLTSPPYNVGKKYGGADQIDAHSFHYSLGHLMMVTSEMTRTLKPGGVLALQLGSTRDPHGQMYPLDLVLSGHLTAMGLTFQSRVMLEIPHGLTPARRLAERVETILILSKGEPATFNPTPARIPQKQPGKRAFKGPNKGQLSGNPLGAWPSNVWRVGNVGHNHPDKKWGGGHPAQFPEELARRVIMLYSMPGDLICDCFVGTGTTAAVAKKTGRAFTGCDLFYEDTRRKRLEVVAPDLVSILPGVTDESLQVWQAEARAVRQAAAPAAAEQFGLNLAACHRP